MSLRQMEFKEKKARSDFQGKRTLVVGLGVSGVSSALWLKRMGADLIATDLKKEGDLPERHISKLKSLNINIEAGKHREETFLSADLIVLSPGVPTGLDLIDKAKKKGVPVIGEMELASRYIDVPLIAITGTNGKSTTTELISAILRKGGFRVFKGGNIGRPLIELLVKREQVDYAVIEVSSFQLESIETFAPYISTVLNVSPDHLERYRDFESYARTKLKIYMNQTPSSHLILNRDDEFLKNAPFREGIIVHWFSSKESENVDAYLGEDEKIIFKVPSCGMFKMELSRFPIRGIHNAENIMASVISGLILGVKPENIIDAIAEYRQLPHRLQLVESINGVDFYNDSKATNIDSARKSIMSFERPIILIAGGRHKGSDYGSFAEACRKRVKFAFLIGESRELIAKAFRGVVPFDFADTLHEAVSRAYSIARSGDVVLLAPACSSFDMFRDYVHRGEEFERIVREFSYGNHKAKISGI